MADKFRKFTSLEYYRACCLKGILRQSLFAGAGKQNRKWQAGQTEISGTDKNKQKSKLREETVINKQVSEKEETVIVRKVNWAEEIVISK